MFNRWHGRRDRRIKSGEVLSATFQIAIDAVKTDDGHAGHLLEKILFNEFEKQKIAVREFRLHLRGSELDSFDKIWEQYHGGHEDYPDFMQYIMGDFYQKLFLHNVNEILKFTNKT